MNLETAEKIGTIISVILSAVAVIIAIEALNRQSKAAQFQIFENCFSRIINLEREYYEKYES